MTLCIALPICCAAYLFPTNRWWRMTGSNRRPPACKAGALPAELIPQIPHVVVGLVGLEPTTPALSRRCSNQLSYRPGRLGERSNHLISTINPLTPSHHRSTSTARAPSLAHNQFIYYPCFFIQTTDKCERYDTPRRCSERR